MDPDGFNFHERTHNDNGKYILQFLIKSSLGMCKPLDLVHNEIMVCDQNYFRVHRTTHSKGQPQSDPIHQEHRKY